MASRSISARTTSRSNGDGRQYPEWERESPFLFRENKRIRSVIITAHVTEITGRFSETVAAAALMAAGWTVHKPLTDEAYDYLATDPANGEHYRIQVKTIRQRSDRGNELVVYAKKGNGDVYTKSDADYIIGVWAENGVIPRVYMFEVRGIGEYWASEAKAAERWIELPIMLDRGALTETERSEAVAAV